MLRAIRFSSRFGFELDTALFEAIRGHHAALRHVSAERCYDELERMLCGPSPAQAMLLLHQTMLWDDVFPELQWNAVHGAILETTAPSPAMRWAALGRGNTTVTGDRRPLPILDEFTEEDSRRMGRVLKRLKSSNALQREATALLRMRVEDLPQSREMMQRFMGKHQKLTDAHLAFLSAEVEAAQMEGMDSLRWSRRVMLAGELEEDVIRLKLPVGLQDLAVRGNTLLSWGCAPGEPIGEALCLLLDAVIDGKTENTADALRQYWRMQQKGEK